jgi:hypothetical protein
MELPTYKAVRLIFEYEGDAVRLVSQQYVEMAVTGFDMSGVDHPGYYVDTRDAAGATLARVAAHGAFAGSAEVFPERHGDPITRVEIAVPRGAFTVVVPVTDSASHVAVTKVAPGAAGQAPRDASARGVSDAVATDMATFPLAAPGQPNSAGGTP